MLAGLLATRQARKLASKVAGLLASEKGSKQKRWQARKQPF